VPSPRTRQGSSGESHTLPTPGLAESAARSTGTRHGVRRVSSEDDDKAYCYPSGERKIQPIDVSCSLLQ